jgi:hypothetical protein
MEPVNPYQAPTIQNEGSARPRSRPNAWRTVAFGLAGALNGYGVLTILANLEDWQFYTLRSFVTGETAMSEITQHPADWWLRMILLFSAVLGGATAGFWIARRQPKDK